MNFRRKEKMSSRELNNYLVNAIYHKNAKIVREYLNEIETIAIQNNQHTNELQDWLNWANIKTDWFDPVTKSEDWILNNSDKEELIPIKKNDTFFTGIKS